MRTKIQPLLRSTGRLLTLLFALTATQVPAQDVKQDSVLQDPVFRAWSKNPEVQRCGVCHYSPGNPFSQRDTDFCQLNETSKWLEQDKHAVSRYRIEPWTLQQYAARTQGLPATALGDSPGESNLLSLRICQQLGYEVDSAQGYALFRDNCLTCHAGFRSGGPTEPFEKEVANHPGISCTYCHQSGPQQTWIDAHSSLHAKHAWRLQPPEAKAQQGMRALVDTHSQADLCLDCHVGSHEKQMFVTHAMYAAGHPPLPGVELQQFIASMPAHWRTHRELTSSFRDDATREAYYSINFPNVAAHPGLDTIQGTFWDTRGMLIGAVEAARKSVSLVANSGEQFGDYAMYDCAACHHELKLPSNRQQRGYVGAPGRPRLTEWPSPLLDLAVTFSAQRSALEKAKGELQRDISAVPFGLRDESRHSAQLYTEQLQRLTDELATLHIDRAVVVKCLQALATTPQAKLANYHAGRQVIWAIQLIDRELVASGNALKPEIRTAIQALGGPAPQPFIATGLPATRSAEIYPNFLRDELQRIARYDAAVLESQLRTLNSKW